MEALRWVGRRLKEKLISAAPVAVGAVVIFAVMWAVIALVRPHLPEGWQTLFEQAESGKLTEARDTLDEQLGATGTTKEVAFVGFQVLQVVIAPIPGQLAGLVGGWLFGFWRGLGLT